MPSTPRTNDLISLMRYRIQDATGSLPTAFDVELETMFVGVDFSTEQRYIRSMRADMRGTLLDLATLCDALLMTEHGECHVS